MVTDWKVQYYEDSCTPQMTYRFNAVPIKITVAFLVFAEMIYPTLKFICNYKGLQLAKTTLKKKKQEDSYFLISKLIKATVIETVWHQPMDKHVDKQNTIECPLIT